MPHLVAQSAVGVHTRGAAVEAQVVLVVAAAGAATALRSEPENKLDMEFES